MRRCDWVGHEWGEPEYLPGEMSLKYPCKRCGRAFSGWAYIHHHGFLWSGTFRIALVVFAVLVVMAVFACKLARAALPVPMPADGSVRRFARPDPWEIKSMNFESITPSTNFEAADLAGPAPDHRVERHGEILREWSEFRIIGPHECCGDVVAWNGLRLVAEFMRGAK